MQRRTRSARARGRWFNAVTSLASSSMAAVALAIRGGGALSSFETTVLLTVEESMDALQKAGEIRYQAPGEG